MSIRQISQTITGTTDFTNLKEEVTRNARGLNTISLSNYSADTAPVVKVGSVFENNNVTFLVEIGDETPTGYAGVAVSTTFYLYYKSSATTGFIFSSTAPTWSDALQGYYNGNDRAFFSMYKDSGGTLYEDKTKFLSRGEIGDKTIKIGSWDMDADGTILVNHRLPDHELIRGVFVFLYSDTGTTLINLNAGAASLTDSTPQGWVQSVTSTAISLYRLTGGSYDNTSFDDTSINRGYVTITYQG